MRFWLKIIAVGLVSLLWVCQIWRSGWCNDESAHIPAGLYHWETGRMDAYRVNPPLPRLIGAIPLLIDRPDLEWFTFDDLRMRNEYRFANEWIERNGAATLRQLRLARLLMVGFFLLGAWTSFNWARDLYGMSAGYLALAMWSFSPDFLAFSATVAPDLPAAATGLFAGHQFWKWINADDTNVPWLVGIAVAMAILCKFSWLFLLGLLPFLLFCRDFIATHGSSINRSDSALSTTAQRLRYAFARTWRLVTSFLLTWLLINSFYGFEGTGNSLGSYRFISQSLAGNPISDGATGNRFANTWAGRILVPFPKEMLQGMDHLRWEFERGYPCYLRGEWQDRGWWYFYLYAMAVKIPLGYWLLIALATATWLRDCWLRRAGTDEWLPLLIAITFVAQVSSQTGFTHHVRYVLPAYGFLFVFAARIMRALPENFAAKVAIVSLAGVVLFHVLHPGLAHTYFNLLAGGPNQGWRHLSHSNVDWGQSTLRIVQWVKDHPEQRPLTVQFARIAGNPPLLLQGMENVNFQIALSDNRPQQGWYLLSSDAMTSPISTYFQQTKPVAQPYPDMLLFYVGERKPWLEFVQ